MAQPPYDLLLSSGFLAFGSQAGFLAAVEEADVRIDAVCGTSSGALAASLWLSGMRAAQVFDLLTSRAPLRTVSPNARWWRGALRLDPVIELLRQHLPARFEDLDRPFAVGVADSLGGHRLLRSGPLPEAVAASCAMPFIFEPVTVDGEAFADGGAVDRTGIMPFRAMRSGRPLLVHLVDRSHGADGPVPPDDVCIVRSKRSGAQMWNLGPAAQRFRETRAETLRALSDLPTRRA